MRRLTGLVLGLTAALLGVVTAPDESVADTVGTTGGADPGLGSISAGVYTYAGGWSGRRSPCTWDPYSGDTAVDYVQGGPVLTRVRDGVTQTAYLRQCPGGGYSVVWIAPGDPPGLGRVAASRLASLLPAPVAGSAPPLDELVVGVDTWWWTTTPWRPISVTAWVPTLAGGTVWAVTTATPRAVVFEPGDGSPPVECTGPGQVWTEADGDEASSDCMVVYRHASVTAVDGVAFRARMVIEWDVSWVGSTGGGGALPALSTATPLRVAVGEIQAVGTS